MPALENLRVQFKDVIYPLSIAIADKYPQVELTKVSYGMVYHENGRYIVNILLPRWSVPIKPCEFVR